MEQNTVTENALVSIISPCFNGKSYIENFLKSILSQTYHPIELIIVDDGSTDGTRQIIEQYRQKFSSELIELKYAFQENGGQAKAINTGLQYVSGEFLMWVDSDDILLPSNVEKKVRYLESHKDVGLVMSKAYVANSDNVKNYLGTVGRTRPQTDDDFFDDLLFDRNCCFNPSVYMAKMDAVKKTIPDLCIYESREGQNWQMLLPISYSTKYGYIDEPLSIIIEHRDSHSRVRRTGIETIRRDIGIIDLLTNTINRIPQMPHQDKERILHSIGEYRWKKVWRKAKILKNREYALMAAEELSKLDVSIGINDYIDCFKQKYGNTNSGTRIRKILHRG